MVGAGDAWVGPGDSVAGGWDLGQGRNMWGAGRADGQVGGRTGPWTVANGWARGSGRVGERGWANGRVRW